MIQRDEKIWELISIKREIGEKVEIPEFEEPLEVVSNETFAIKAIQEVSSLKYFYDIEAPIMYCLHYGICPADLQETLKIFKNGLRELGWKVPN